jgi:predicted nucleic acid-binding protein
MSTNRVYVCDTHSLVWFLTQDQKLSRKALSVLLDAEAGNEIVYVPTIVLSEFLSMTRRGRVSWELLFRLMARLRKSTTFRVATLDLEVFGRMIALVIGAQIPEGKLDLHDLSILGTAMDLDATLITRDPGLRGQTIVPTLW